MSDSMTLTREPPHNFEAEQALLGAILSNNAAYHQVCEIVDPGRFADPLHGRLYDAIAKLIERGQLVTAVTLKTYAESDASFAEVGGAAYLARLLVASAPATDAASFARVVRDAAIRRRLIALATDALAAAYAPKPEQPARADVERLERGLYELGEDGSEGGFRSFARSLARAVDATKAAHDNKGAPAGLATGLASLDDQLGGLHRSDLVVLAGRPGMGKTALATNIAFAAARSCGAPVGFFSLEMSAEQLAVRILAEQAGVAAESMRRGQLSSEEIDCVIAANRALEAVPLHIDDTPALTIGALRARARRLKRQHGLGLVVVDYLQLVETANRKDGRVQEVSEISRGLKTLAKELDVPVLALSQLNRKVEEREDKHPLLADLRDSGTIEQDADVVLFVYREEYYRLLKGEKPGDAAGKAELHIAKHRHGPTGKVMLRFDGAKTRFSDVGEAEEGEVGGVRDDLVNTVTGAGLRKLREHRC